MNELVDFLRARLADDDAVAFFASEDEKIIGPLAAHGIADDDHRVPHVNRWSPARVHAECVTKLRILDAYESTQPPWPSHGEDTEWLAVEWALKCLALPYVDHPDYREEWKP